MLNLKERSSLLMDEMEPTKVTINKDNYRKLIDTIKPPAQDNDDTIKESTSIPSKLEYFTE